jgi:cell division protein FtsX
MQRKITGLAGVTASFIASSAWGQGASAPDGAASTRVPDKGQIVPPGDPSWLVVVVAMVIGIAIGYIAAKMTGRSVQTG